MSEGIRRWGMFYSHKWVNGDRSYERNASGRHYTASARQCAWMCCNFILCVVLVVDGTAAAPRRRRYLEHRLPINAGCRRVRRSAKQTSARRRSTRTVEDHVEVNSITNERAASPPVIANSNSLYIYTAEFPAFFAPPFSIHYEAV